MRPDLVALSEAPEAYLRRRAALAIGRVGLSTGVDALRARLADDEPAVREMAAFGLGLLGDAAAVDDLIAALDDPSPLVQGRAAQALGLIGAPSAADAIGAMVQRYVPAAFEIDPEEMGHPLAAPVEALRLGLFALGDLRAFDPLADALLEEGQPILWWWPVAYALGRTEDPRALPALATLAGVDGRFGPALAARGLGALGDPRGVPALDGMLAIDRRHPHVVASAVRALGGIDDPQAAAALDRFVRIRGLDRQLRLTAVEALARTTTQAAVEVFVELLGHPWARLRAASIRALARTDPEAFVFVLSGLGPDPDWRVRAAVASGLAAASAPAAWPRLAGMIDDADQRVVPAVLDALVASGVPDASGYLLHQLHAPDAAVVAAAARLLGELRPSGAEAALAAAYDAAAADPSHRARAAIVDALAAGGGAAARETLRRALDDPDWAVRIRAAEHLDRLDPAAAAADAIRPAPGRRSVDHAAPQLIRPTVSPHVYMETPRGTIQIELAVLDAPITAYSFATLARQGFFDRLTFHRVAPGDLVFSGDPRSDDTGGPGFSLRDERSERPFLRGTVGLARDWADTGGSRFFIAQAPQPQLDARYTAFGRVVAGMEVVDRLEPGDRIDQVLVWDGVQPFRGAGAAAAAPADDADGADDAGGADDDGDGADDVGAPADDAAPPAPQP